MQGKKTGGRVKGTPNHATRLAREAIAKFVDGNAHRLQTWLDEIAAADNGALKAFTAFTDLLEYHVPKLGRVEHIGDDGGPIQLKIISYGDGTAKQLGPKKLSAGGVEGSVERVP
jgi:hypothetical protein